MAHVSAVSQPEVASPNVSAIWGILQEEVEKMTSYHEIVVEVLLFPWRFVHADTFSQNWTLQAVDAEQNKRIRVSVGAEPQLHHNPT